MPLDTYLPQDPVLAGAVKAALVIAGYAVAAALARMTVVHVGRVHDHDPMRIRGMLGTARAILRGLFLFVLLIVLGVDLAMIPAYLGSFLAVVGVACFASWSILSNITSGLIIFAAKDLETGDQVRIHDEKEPIVGTIEEFRLWSMVVKLQDGALAYVPNNVVLQRPTVIVRSARQGRTTRMIGQAPQEPG